MMGKQGNSIMMGIMILILAFTLFIATLPMMKTMFDGLRGSDNFNCVGYIDRDASGATNFTYDTGVQTEKMACSILDLGIPFMLLAVLVGLIGMFLKGRLGEDMDQERPSY